MGDDISKTAVAAIAALIGFAASLLTTYLTTRSAAKREADTFARTQVTQKANLRREKGEELYMLIDKELEFRFGQALRYREAALSRSGNGTAFQGDLVASRGLSEARARLPMLLDVYFPNLRPRYIEFMHATEDFGRLLNEVDQQPLVVEVPSDELARRIDLTGIGVQARGSDLKKSLAEEIRGA